MKKENKIPKVRCLYDKIITTANVQFMTESGVILSPSEKGTVMTRQTVLVAGPNAIVKPGDEIEINSDRFQRIRREPKNGIGPDKEFIIPPIEVIDKEQYLFISSSEIKYIYLNE